MIELVLAVAANTMLSPLDLATRPEPGINATTSIACGTKDVKNKKVNASMSSSTSQVGANFTIDDWRTWD